VGPHVLLESGCERGGRGGGWEDVEERTADLKEVEGGLHHYEQEEEEEEKERGGGVV